MKRILGIGFAVLALVLVAGATAIFLIPIDTYRGTIADAASRATGRQVAIEGPLNLTLFPEIGISVKGVSLANVAGARDPLMLSVGEVIVGAKLFPLLSGRLEVTHLVFQKPVIHLEVAKDGRANWAFEGMEQNRDAGAQDNTMSSLGLADVKIEDGALSYFDARDGVYYALDDADIGIRLTEATGLSLNGALNYNKERLTLALAMTSPMALAEAGTSSTHIVLKSNVVNGEFKGTLSLSARSTGTLKLGAKSMRNLVAWTGNPMPAGPGFGLMALEANVVKDGENVGLAKLTMAFDGMSVNGDLGLTLGERMGLRGTLSIDHMDLNTYMSGASSSAKATPAAADTGWSREPISLSALNIFDAELDLNVGQMRMQKLAFDRAYMSASLKNGVLRANLKGVALYGGKGKGSLSVDTNRSVPEIRASLDVSGIKVQTFMRDFMEIERFDGLGTVNFDVASRGANQYSIMSGLNGKASLKFTDGKIKGVDLAAVARMLKSVGGMVTGLTTLGAATSETASTDYAEMSGTFAIANGVMKNKDFRLLNPFLRITGQGDVNLAARSLDFHLEPKLVASTQGQGGADAKGIAVPFRVHGPWTKPEYTPDARKIVNSVIESVTSGEGLGGLLEFGRGLFGGR